MSNFNTQFNTQFTTIGIYPSDPSPDLGDTYLGHMAIEFHATEKLGIFFMLSNEHSILEEVIRAIPKELADERNVRIDDMAILMELTTLNEARYAPDLVKIVRKHEKIFIDKIKEL